MDYKEDIQKVIQLIEEVTQDTTNSASDSTISELIKKFRHQQKLTQIGDSSPKQSLEGTPLSEDLEPEDSQFPGYTEDLVDVMIVE